ncbi:MAG: DUF2442 domain-containing protein [Proteobacteria bacterium]|nr:DUF2442 domain-containing protein [Pseudomonadota bacterium]
MKLTEDSVLEIVSAQHASNYIISIEFSDGTRQVVDFGPFLKNSLNPLISKYLDIDLFKQFSLDFGDLQWNDYDLCFPIADLHECKI